MKFRWSPSSEKHVAIGISAPLTKDEAQQLLQMAPLQFSNASATAIRRNVAMLFAAMRSQSKSKDELKLFAEACVEDLSDFPEDVIAEACRSIRRSEEWFPSIAQLREECWRVGNRRMTWKRAILDALRDPD